MNKVEEYIEKYTRKCSNMNVYGEWEPWLTPFHAEQVAQIAREEMAEQFARIVRGHLSQIDKEVQIKFEQLYTDITGENMYGGFTD